jgi:phage-related holin
LSAGYLHGISVFKADHNWGDASATLTTNEADSPSNSDLARPVETYRPSAPQLGGTEMATVLGLLNLLFASFVAVQLKYLFGGASLVSLTPGLTYADYVHKGFTELNTVVALVLPLLLIADVVFVRKTRGGETLFRVNAGMLIGLVMIILASAMQRMSLYQTEYGQSELRLYVTVFMTWLGTVCAIFAATVLNGNRQRFAFASYASGVAILALVNLANPDAMIEASNIKMAHAKGNFDVNYALALSNDAIPTLLSQLDALPEESQRAVAMKLLTQKRGAWKTDWRNLNFSRMAAYQAVVDNTKKLERIAGLEKPVTM